MMPTDEVASTRARPGRSVVFAVAALAAGVVAGVLVAPGPERLAPPTPTTEPVASATFVCPDYRGKAGSNRTTILASVPTIAALPEAVQATTPRRGAAVIGLLAGPGAGRPLARLTRRGASALISSSSRSLGPVVGSAVGGLAPGFSAGQLSSQYAGPGRGLAGIDCATAGSEQWFVGPGSAAGQTSQLILANPQTSAATVDIEVFGRSGVIDAPGGQGVVVGPRRSRVLLLDALAPGQTRLVLHVTAVVGRVAVAVRTFERRGNRPLGIDFVPPAGAPALRQVIPALPGGRGFRDLVVSATGSQDADVRVRVIGRRDSFAPARADRFTVGAGTVTKIDLSKVLTPEDSALLIESTAPVVAGARVRIGGGSSRRAYEYAWSAAVPALTGTAIEAYSATGNGYAAWLMLSCPDGAGRVEVVTGPASGTARRIIVVVPSGRTSTVPLRIPGGRGALITVVRPLPGSAPVWAGRVQYLAAPDGRMLTISPLRDARVAVDVPQSVPDLSAELPRASRTATP